MTFVFPLVLLLIVGGLAGDSRVPAIGAPGEVSFTQWYTPSIGIFGLTMACYSGVISGCERPPIRPAHARAQQAAADAGLPGLRGLSARR